MSTKFVYFESDEISLKEKCFDFSVDAMQLINLTYYYLFLGKLDRCDGSSTSDVILVMIYIVKYKFQIKQKM